MNLLIPRQETSGVRRLSNCKTNIWLTDGERISVKEKPVDIDNQNEGRVR